MPIYLHKYVFITILQYKQLETMTIETTKQIILQLEAENLESNTELINFYKRKIKEAVSAAIEKGFNQ